MEKLLDNINSPADLKKLPQEKLKLVADQLRSLIIDTVSKTGGHLASSLGVVELSVAIHYLFNAPDDFIFWDVGHQAYAHKILTGRRRYFGSLRQLGGLSGFPNKYESPYDPVTCGHSSTSISSALGAASARDLSGKKRKVIAVIGDAALAGGMAFEALNHAGHLKKDLIVILNDNEMSIARPIGAMSKYLNRVISAPVYNRVRKEVEALVKRIPRYGFLVYRAARRLEEGLKNLLIPGILFEELGFRYFGPIDGHNIDVMLATIKNIKDLNEPVLIHILTKKGKGYKFAEDTPDKFHGTGPFDIESGGKPRPPVRQKPAQARSFTEVFGDKMLQLARRSKKIAAVTAAMPDGTGLKDFSREFPERFFDVGIAEGHAVGFSEGLALGGLTPVLAVYSTFLQRSYDQIIHDTALQNLHVVFAVDRAGLVGEDGPTHHGPFDIAYLGSVPNMAVAAPADQQELADMLEFAVGHNGPIALRYPRGGIISSGRHKEQGINNRTLIELGKAQVLREGNALALIALGSMVYPSLEAALDLAGQGIEACVVNARFAKPFDIRLFLELSGRIKKFLVVEEGIVQGGFGSNVMEFFHSQAKDIKIKLLGLPDVFIEHGPRDVLLERYGLSSKNIAKVAASLV